jgi:hypothetical protein
MISLENFDLEEFFHDDTFIDMLDIRKKMDENYKNLSDEEKKLLFYFDEIINGYTNIYARKELDGYAKMSFDILQKINNISEKSITLPKAS